MVDSHGRYTNIRSACCPPHRGIFLWLFFFYVNKETADMWVSTELGIFSCPVRWYCVDIANILCLDRHYMIVSTVVERKPGRQSCVWCARLASWHRRMLQIILPPLDGVDESWRWGTEVWMLSRKGFSLLHQNFTTKPQGQITRLTEHKCKVETKYENYISLLW